MPKLVVWFPMKNADKAVAALRELRMDEIEIVVASPMGRLYVERHLSMHGLLEIGGHPRALFLDQSTWLFELRNVADLLAGLEDLAEKMKLERRDIGVVSSMFHEVVADAGYDGYRSLKDLLTEV